MWDSVAEVEGHIDGIADECRMVGQVLYLLESSLPRKSMSGYLVLSLDSLVRLGDTVAGVALLIRVLG